MKDRNVNILQAAQSVFARYGVNKTTMNDIAREAGIARQTLYNAYPSKEAVLRATLRLGAENTIAAVEAKWRDQTTLSDKLDAFFELTPLYWYDVVQSAPDVAELIDGINAIAQDELTEITKLWNSRFENVIRAHSQPGTTLHTNASDIADFIYSTSMNAKYNAANRSILESRLDVLKISILALFDSSENV
jgi:AcrR family transcriptional regulator